MGCLPFASFTGKQGIWVPILLFRSFLPAHNAPSLVGEYLPQAPKNAQQVCGYAMEHRLNSYVYGLRYGSHLTDMNIIPHLLCNQMGHGKIETTRKYYIAVSEDGIAELKRGLELL